MSNTNFLFIEYSYMFRPSVIIRPCFNASQKIPCTYCDPICLQFEDVCFYHINHTGKI